MNLLLCSANSSVRDRWKQILQNDYQLNEADSVVKLEKMTQNGKIDLIVLHRSLVDLNFIANINSAPFIVFTDVPDDNEAVSVLRSGALGYANAYISETRMSEAIKVVLSGRVWIGRRLMQKIIKGTSATIAKKSDSLGTPENLTARELEVAQLVGNGLSNLEIAADLDISERTVKAHIGAIFKKTQTSSRLQLALFMNSQLSDQC